jgi:hypothetical protein
VQISPTSRAEAIVRNWIQLFSFTNWVNSFRLPSNNWMIIVLHFFFSVTILAVKFRLSNNNWMTIVFHFFLCVTIWEVALRREGDNWTPA